MVLGAGCPDSAADDADTMATGGATALEGGDDGGTADGASTVSAGGTAQASATEASASDGTGADDPGGDGTGADATAGDGTGADATAGDGTGADATAGDDADGATTEGAATDGEQSTGSDSTGGEPLSDDPFDPAACNGIAWTAADATAQLGGMSREVLANATIQVRTRDCPGGNCGEWGDNEDWVISYLTWSGGVVTAYKDFLTDMNFVLFDDDGTPRLSMQHVTFATGGYPDTDGVVYDFPPAVVNYPHLRAFDDSPDSRYYYTDLDYQVSEGTLVLGDGCAVWTAFPFGMGTPHTAQYGVVFHW